MTGTRTNGHFTRRPHGPGACGPRGRRRRYLSLADIMDNTWVQGYYHGSPASSWKWQDIVASTPNAWDIKKVGVSWDNVANQVTMQIFTNYRPAGEEGAGQADIALRLDGTGTTGTTASAWPILMLPLLYQRPGAGDPLEEFRRRKYRLEHGELDLWRGL